jgi:hypothetical protein
VPDLEEAMAPSEPIADADPAVRSAKTVQVPARVWVERNDDHVAYGVNEEMPVTLDVGHKMILGTRIVWTARRGQAEPEWLGADLSSVDYGEAACTSFRPVEHEPYVLEAAIEVFETDIPPHHFWTPERGRYRVLWRKTLRADVPAD